jgi:undecaprenyl-diphosphatase
MSLWEKLDEWDKWLFVQLNSHCTNPFFDAVLPYFRDPNLWAPLYLLIISFMLLNYRNKGFWWALFFLLTAALTDILGHRVFKENFERLRPCADPLMAGQCRLLLQRCSGAYSFVSNHAANHFGLATFMIVTFRHELGKWMYLAYFWAFLIVYAQVYVGVHYPLDVLGGAGLGTMAGVLTAWLFHKRWGKLDLNN